MYQVLLNLLSSILEWHLSFQIISHVSHVFTSSTLTSIPIPKCPQKHFGSHLGISPMSQLQCENGFHCKALPRNFMRRLLARCDAYGLLCLYENAASGNSMVYQLSQFSSHKNKKSWGCKILRYAHMVIIHFPTGTSHSIWLNSSTCVHWYRDALQTFER